VAADTARLAGVVQGFHDDAIKVSMFIDPDAAQVRASADIKADFVELHTGAYANAKGDAQENELRRLEEAAELAQGLGLIVNAGHGLTVRNLAPVAAIPGLNEVNIGHDIIARALFIGLDNAVAEILDVLAAY